MGPCMCGDLYCGSCGPAQGNNMCYNCGEWADEHDQPGSEHNDEACSAAVQAADEAEYEHWKWCEEHADEIARVTGWGD